MEKYQSVIIRIIVIIAVLLGLFLLTATFMQLKSYRYIGSGLPASDTITVNGQGTIEKAPDTAKFSFTVQDETQDTASAQAVVSKKVATVKADLLAAGVEDKYITTADYNSYPDYQYTALPSIPSGQATSQQMLKGYIVSQNVTVSLKDLTKTETVAGILGKDGVTSIDGPNLGFEDPHVVQNEARDAAIADAKVQAQKLADSLGVHLVRIVSFSDSGAPSPSPIMYGAKSMMAPTAAAPTIPTGVQSVTSNVSITYEIR
ncbi:MAG: hypothetical protein JWM92_568 [Candidatus Nomurabacteria bacterium]|nr:hypothetical protein [Candidatus Nomurabacteria bacterium]